MPLADAFAFVIAFLFRRAVLAGLRGMDPFAGIDYPLPLTRYS